MGNELKMKVIVHIGYPKAGSTLLQKHIFKNIPNLRVDGVEASRCNLELICELSQQKPNSSVIEDNLKKFYVDESKPLLISHEHFLLPYSNDTELKERFFNDCKREGFFYNKSCDFELMSSNIKQFIPSVKLIVILRSQYDILLSEFAHRLRENVHPWNLFSRLEEYVLENHQAKNYEVLLNILYLNWNKNDVWVSSLELISERTQAEELSLSEFIESGIKFNFNTPENKGEYAKNKIKYKSVFYRLSKVKDRSFFINRSISDWIYYRIFMSNIFGKIIKNYCTLIYGNKNLKLEKTSKLKPILDEYKEINKRVEKAINKTLHIQLDEN